MGLAQNSNSTADRPPKDFIAKLPKVELHRHLEGTYPIDSLFKMSLKNNLDVPSDFEAFKKEFQFPKDHESDFLLFLSKFKKFWYKSMADVESIAYDSVKSFSEDNLHYIELRFNPLHFTELTGFDPLEVTRTIINSSDAAASEINLNIRYILTFNRAFHTARQMLDTYKLLHKTDLSRVVGIDLAGDEINFPPELFPDFFDAVKSDGVYGIDIHAGEVTDSKNIWVAIDQLHAGRIGHGVSAIHDPAIQKELKDRKIYLAQCITSNYQTAAWEDEKTHPMGKLVEAGVPLNISSDDPTIQDSTLTDDYMKASKYFNWSVEKLIELNKSSIQGAFLNEQEKKTLDQSYDKAIRNFLSE